MRKIAILAVLVLGIGALLGLVSARTTESASTEAGAGVTDETCVPGDSVCLKELYAAAVQRGDAETVVSGLLDFETGESGCHESAHIAGRIIGAAMPREALLLNSTALDSRCSYGYVHGVFQGLADIGENPVRAARTYCGELAGKLPRSECFHAAGHGAAIVLGNIEAAIDSCRTLAEPDNGSCAGGVYMEHVTSYLGDGGREADFGPRPVSDTQARSMCSNESGLFLYQCARKAALFWGKTLPREALEGKCEELAVKVADPTDVMLECGAGAGEWLRNDTKWSIPRTLEEANEMNLNVVSECLKLAAGRDGSFLAGCFEGVIAAVLPGQVAGVEDRDAWINPCRSITEDYPIAKRECTTLRSEIAGEGD